MDEAVQEFITLENENSVILNGFDDAIIGMSHTFGKDPVVAYSVDKLLTILMDDGMTREDAYEYFEYNILGAHFSDHNPVFISDFDKQSGD